MNINKNNYEEYFLLYADNELTPAERKMVEIFVKENPELKEEFCMLKLTISSPDEDIKLTDKSFLMKKEPSLINEKNYEEIFVLYHDNELTEKEKLETETFVIQHPDLKAEFELIGKAKLIPESLIVYRNKKELYRKEKPGKVVPLFVWRSIAAAVFIGFGLWISVPYFKNHDSKPPVVAQINTAKKPEAPIKVATAEPNKEQTLVASSSVIEKVKGITKGEVKSEKPIVKEEKNDIAAVKKEVKIKKPSYKENIQDLNVQEPIQTIAINAPIKKIQESPQDFKNSIDENERKAAINQIEPKVKNNYSQTAAYTTDASVNNDNYVFYDVPAEQFRKSKVGGFLKKVRRIVERTNPITRLLEGNGEPVVAKNF
jgi:hypothetical protein